jgi:aryl-alcohol dehydrogenase-like predicted oxidoreductase
MHHVERETPWEEIWQAMEQLVREGKLLYAGSSNFAAWHIAMAQCSAADRHFMGLVSEQSRYNLASRTIELEVIPACIELGIAVLPYGPLRGGMLAGGMGSAKEGRRSSEGTQNLYEKHRPQVEAYEALCHITGIEPAHMAHAWMLQRPGITSPILGPRTTAQLEHSVRSLEIKLSDEIMAKLDEIWPAPGIAPEAYAW